MDEILLLMVLLFAAYLFMPKTWYSKFVSKDKSGELAVARSGGNMQLMPQDSVLRRHYITQLRSEIELELFPRPTDFNLQRHYDALVAAELENRLSTLVA